MQGCFTGQPPGTDCVYTGQSPGVLLREGVSPDLPLPGWESAGRHSWAGVGEELAEGWKISIKGVVGTRFLFYGTCAGIESVMHKPSETIDHTEASATFTMTVTCQIFLERTAGTNVCSMLSRMRSFKFLLNNGTRLCSCKTSQVNPHYYYMRWWITSNFVNWIYVIVARSRFLM